MEARNCLGQSECVSRADHRGDPFLALARIGGFWSEWPDPPPPGETQRGLDSLLFRVSGRIGAVRLVDSGAPEFVDQPSLAVTAGAQRTRFGERERGIVDEAELGEAIGETLEVRGIAALPSALTHLAREILAKLGPCRGIFADVAQCELAQSLDVERRGRAAGPDRCLHARFVPQSQPKGKAATLGMRSRRMRNNHEGNGVLDRNASVTTELAPAGATPTLDKLPRRLADFATIGAALDYAAQGRRGLNFHNARGALTQSYTYAEMREAALLVARRFVSLGIKRADRIALVAETGPEFAAAFFGAVYAGAWPVPLPLPTSFGGRDAYVDQLTVQLGSCDPALFLVPPELAEFGKEAADRAGVLSRSWDTLEAIDPAPADLPAAQPDDIAYLQYSSGSTRFPHGVAVTHRALLDNLRAHGIGLQVKDTDRCISWLPWYHDMGLVGCFLSPMSLQMSVDYLMTEDFVGPPLAWLDMITRNPGTTVSYSPTFGYDICSRRMSSQTRAEDRFDLSRWRIVGNGADMIRPEVMQAFVDSFDAAGFKASAFCPSSGLAEATLAVSLMPPGEGIRLELVEEQELSGCARDKRRPRRYRAVVNCGRPVTGMQVEIRGPSGEILPDRGTGKVFVRGASVLHSHLRDEE